MFKQVLAKDPGFAPAHAGLAIAYALMSVPSGSAIPFVEAQSIIRTAAVKALELDPLLADAHAAMGWVHARELDWSSAETAFQRAIDLNPSLSQTYTGYSTSTLRPLGKQDDALRILRVALQNDPLSLNVQREIGFVQMETGQYRRSHRHVPARARGRTRLSFCRQFPRASARVRRETGGGVTSVRKNAAISAAKTAPEAAKKPPDGAGLCRVRDARGGGSTGCRACGRRPPSTLAAMYTALGDKDRAFEALERTAFVEPQRLPLLLVYPEIAVLLRGDPRLASLRQRFRLPPQ